MNLIESIRSLRKLRKFLAGDRLLHFLILSLLLHYWRYALEALFECLCLIVSRHQDFTAFSKINFFHISEEIGYLAYTPDELNDEHRTESSKLCRSLSDALDELKLCYVNGLRMSIQASANALRSDGSYASQGMIDGLQIDRKSIVALGDFENAISDVTAAEKAHCAIGVQMEDNIYSIRPAGCHVDNTFCISEPGLPQPGLLSEPGLPQPGLPQPGLPSEPGLPQPGLVSEPCLPYPGLPDPGLPSEPGLPSAIVPAPPAARTPARKAQSNRDSNAQLKLARAQVKQLGCAAAGRRFVLAMQHEFGGGGDRPWHDYWELSRRCVPALALFPPRF